MKSPLPTILSALALCATLLDALPPPPSFLLPDNVTPKKYTVDLTIDPNHDAFEGRVQIEVELRKSEKLIWLNAKDLTIYDAAITAAGRERAVRAEPAGGEF